MRVLFKILYISLCLLFSFRIIFSLKGKICILLALNVILSILFSDCEKDFIAFTA